MQPQERSLQEHSLQGGQVPEPQRQARPDEPPVPVGEAAPVTPAPRQELRQELRQAQDVVVGRQVWSAEQPEPQLERVQLLARVPEQRALPRQVGFARPAVDASSGNG